MLQLPALAATCQAMSGCDSFVGYYTIPHPLNHKENACRKSWSQSSGLRFARVYVGRVWGWTNREVHDRGRGQAVCLVKKVCEEGRCNAYDSERECISSSLISMLCSMDRTNPWLSTMRHEAAHCTEARMPNVLVMTSGRPAYCTCMRCGICFDGRCAEGAAEFGAYCLYKE